MANYQQLKAAIDQVIKANGQKEITGPALNGTLKSLVNSLGIGYQFMGVATPSTNPGTPDQNVFYIAGHGGIYTNFGGIEIPDGITVLLWNGSWTAISVFSGDGVFNISAYRATGGTLANYADLAAALDGGNNIPQLFRKGGMSVKFVQSIDNKYVQYFCNSQLFSTRLDSWEKVNLEKELNRLNDKVDEFIGGTIILNPIAIDGIMVLTTIATQANHITYYVPVIQGEDINVKLTFDNNANWSRRGYTTQIPENGVAVTGYAEGHSLNTTLTPAIDGYFVVSCEKTATHTIEITKEVKGIEHDVEQLQTQVGTNTTNITKNTLDISNNSDNIVENTYDIGVPVDYSKVIQSGATYVSFPIDVHLLKGLSLKITLNYSPLSGNHSVYRCRGKETGIIDGLTIAVGETKTIKITDETNYLWVFLSGTVSEESTISVTLQNSNGASTQVDKLLNTVSFRYLYEGGFLYILKHCGSTDFIISFGRGGGNNLWDFRGFYTKDPADDFEVANLTRFHYNDSDWFAPFKIRAVNNIDGDDHELNPYNEYFTGGAHQYNNQQSGSTPTARGLDTVIIIDGKPISSYSSGIGRVLKMTWTNYIQAYNTRKVDGTGREVLKEVITLTYDGIKWDAETVLQPLEDIYLDLWYGYETTGVGTDMSSHWRFINAVNRGEDPADSGNYDAIGFDSYGGSCNVRCIVDNSFDIGNREFVYEESTQGAFKSGSKLYFLIDNKWSLLTEVNNYYLRGTYYIEKT